MADKTTVSLTSLICAGCGEALKGGFLGIGGPLGQLRKASGRCSRCGGNQFNAGFTVRRTYHENPTDGEVGGALIGSALASAALGGIAFGTPGASSGKTERTFEVSGLESGLLLEKMNLPPEDQVAWIVSVFKEAAKANLTAEQGLCFQCGEIYRKGQAGPTSQGYCSALCAKKKRAEGGDAAAPAPAVAGMVDCPHCGRKLRVKAAPFKCMFCGKTVPA